MATQNRPLDLHYERTDRRHGSIRVGRETVAGRRRGDAHRAVYGGPGALPRALLDTDFVVSIRTIEAELNLRGIPLSELTAE
jgi:hypothetical protein